MYSFQGDGERCLAAFSRQRPSVSKLLYRLKSSLPVASARGCENEREEEELSSSSAEKRNFASAETAGVRSRLYRGLARGVVSRAERVRSAAVYHSINQSCCCCCCCCCASRVGGTRERSNSVTRSVNGDRPVEIYVGYIYMQTRKSALRISSKDRESKTWTRERERENGNINYVNNLWHTEI